MALSLAGEARTAMLVGWIETSMAYAEKMLAEGERQGPRDPVKREAIRAERKAVMADRRRRTERLASRLGVTGKRPRSGDESTMAKRQGRDGEYHLYLYATQVTHGAESGYFLDADPVGDLDATGPARTDQSLIGVVLGLAVPSILRAHIATATMLGWPGADTAQDLLDRPLSRSPAE